MVVLLEEHPLEHLGALVPVARNEARALAEVPEDRAGLGERAAVVEDEGGDPEGRVQLTEELGPVRAIRDVDCAPLERKAEMGKKQPHLVAVARDGAVVQEHLDDHIGRGLAWRDAVGGSACRIPTTSARCQALATPPRLEPR